MKKIFGILFGALCWFNVGISCATEKFDILPDLPEPLATAQAASVSTASNDAILTTQSIGHEPNIFSVILALLFVIVLIYATGIIYTKLNKAGFNTMKRQLGDKANSQVSVVSTTQLGNNKTLHVVELDGKRMLLGASAGSIQLLKDLGTFPPIDTETLEYSKIEIPNIRIPKIEIPKIEFPNIGFTKASTSVNKSNDDNNENSNTEKENTDDFEISDIYEEGPDGIIDKLFQTQVQEDTSSSNVQKTSEHTVDPEEYALYKKYL